MYKLHIIENKSGLFLILSQLSGIFLNLAYFEKNVPHKSSVVAYFYYPLQIYPTNAYGTCHWPIPTFCVFVLSILAYFSIDLALNVG